MHLWQLLSDSTAVVMPEVGRKGATVVALVVVIVHNLWSSHMIQTIHLTTPRNYFHSLGRTHRRSRKCMRLHRRMGLQRTRDNAI